MAGQAERPVGSVSRGTVARIAAVAMAMAVAVESFSVAVDPIIEPLIQRAPGGDKLLHVLAFLGLYIVCDHFLARVISVREAHRLQLALALLSLAFIDELAQGLRDGRSREFADGIASLCGIGLGLSFRIGSRRQVAAAALAVTSVLVAGIVVGQSYVRQRHLNEALRFERAGDFVLARREYRRAFEMGARGSSLLNELSWVEIESGVGEPSVAVEFARRALASRPDSADYLDTYAWALHHSGRSAEALPHLLHAYAAKPDMFCINLHLGAVYLALGNTSQAVWHLERQAARRDTREALRASGLLAQIREGGRQ